jgi:hypothetical protein
MIGQELQKQELRKCPCDPCGFECPFKGNHEACSYFRFFRDEKKAKKGKAKA